MAAAAVVMVVVAVALVAALQSLTKRRVAEQLRDTEDRSSKQEQHHHDRDHQADGHLDVAHAHGAADLLGLLVEGLGLGAQVLGLAFDGGNALTTREQLADVLVHDVRDGVDLALQTANLIGLWIVGKEVLHSHAHAAYGSASWVAIVRHVSPRERARAPYHLLHQEGLELGVLVLAMIRGKVLGFDSLEERIADTLREALLRTADERQLIVHNVVDRVAERERERERERETITWHQRANQSVDR